MSELEDLIRSHHLKVTAPRLAVLSVMIEAGQPLSHTEVLHLLGDNNGWDQATVYRNLIRMTEVGLITLVGRFEGIDRYALQPDTQNTHDHPHFYCDQCGKVSCLPVRIGKLDVQNPVWAEALRDASVQFQGTCPACKAQE